MFLCDGRLLECGAPGDLQLGGGRVDLVVSVKDDWGGQGVERFLRKESQVQVFTAHFEWHQYCMHHCEKIANGRSPPVTIEEEWENLSGKLSSSFKILPTCMLGFVRRLVCVACWRTQTSLGTNLGMNGFSSGKGCPCSIIPFHNGKYGKRNINYVCQIDHI